MTKLRKVALVAFTSLSMLVLFAVPAFAAADTAAVSAVGDSAVTLKDTLVEVATTVLPYAAAVLAITIGWRMARKFVRA